MSKNCRGGIDGCSFETCGRMQEEKQVSAMRLLLEKLHPEVERLFQRALVGKQSLKKTSLVCLDAFGEGRCPRHDASHFHACRFVSKIH